LTFLVVQTEALADDAERWLAERCRVRRVAGADASAIADADALVVRTYTRVDDALLDAAPRLRVVGRAGAGLDNIDVEACRRRGVDVVYTPDANTQAVVEYVVALLGDALRPRPPIARAVDADTWAHLRTDPAALADRQMSEMVLGVLGLGRIGKRVAEVAGVIGFETLYHDVLEIAPPRRYGATPVPAEALFERADVLTIHVDGRPSNRGFIGAPLLDRTKDDVTLINTSRGFVVDNVALAERLRAHPRMHAHLDVHDPEPVAPDNPLLELPNATLYPHLASRTRTALRAMSWVVRDVVAVLEGRTPEFPAP
jgi:phosphoglycerate dehydrogenase-like enzyme